MHIMSDRVENEIPLGRPGTLDLYAHGRTREYMYMSRRSDPTRSDRLSNPSRAKPIASAVRHDAAFQGSA